MTLRPDVQIVQNRVAATAAALDSELPLVLVGHQRQIESNLSAGTYYGGASSEYDIPSLVSGAELVTTDDADQFLTAPVVTLSNSSGTADITSQVTVSATTNTITVPPSLTVAMTYLSRTSGLLSSLVLTDSGARFIQNGIAAGDAVYSGSSQYWSVASVDSDSQLTLTHTNLVTTSELDATTTAPTGKLVTVTLNSGAVPTGIPVGYRVAFTGWKPLRTQRGIDVSVAVTDLRTLTAYQDLIQYSINAMGSAAWSSVWVWDTGDAAYLPKFLVQSYLTSKTLQVSDGLWAPADGTTLSKEAYLVYNHTLKASGADGTWGASGASRTFTSASADFVTSGVATNDIVCDANKNPIFTVSSVDSATQLTVAEIKVGDPGAGAAVGYYVVSSALAAREIGATVSVESGGTRTFTDTTATFTTGITAGDYIRDSALGMDFKIVSIDSATQLTVENAANNTGNWASSGTTGARWTYEISSATEAAELAYRSRTSATVFVVADVSGYLSQAYDYLTVEVTYPASASGLNYSIVKSLSGANVSGTVLVSYMALRTDGTSSIIPVSAADYSAAGSAHPANPIGLAASYVAALSTDTFYLMRVGGTEDADWSTAFANITVDSVYQVVPLSQNDTVLASARSHVGAMATENASLFRILWQSKHIDRQTTRATGSSGIYTNTGSAISVLIPGLLTTTYGTVAGDVFEFVISGTRYTGSVLAAPVESGGSTTLSILYSALFPSGLQTLTSWTVTSAYLTDAEYAAAHAAYTRSLSAYRVRNIFPSRSIWQINGVSYTLGGYYTCAMEAARRAETPVQNQLTGRSFSGIYDLSNPFGASTTYNDVVLDAGNYVMVQPSGAGGAVYPLRAVSTNVSDLVYLDEAVCCQVDLFSRNLYNVWRPLIGPNPINAEFLSLLRIRAQAVISYLVDAGSIYSAMLTSLAVSATERDTVVGVFDLVPYYGSAHALVTINI